MTRESLRPLSIHSRAVLVVHVGDVVAIACRFMVPSPFFIRF